MPYVSEITEITEVVKELISNQSTNQFIRPNNRTKRPVRGALTIAHVQDLIAIYEVLDFQVRRTQAETKSDICYKKIQALVFNAPPPR